MMTLYHLNFDRNPSLAREVRFASADRLRLVATLFAQGGYDEVAHIQGDDPEFAWKATQNGVLSPSWSQQPPTGVIPVEPSYHLHEGEKYGRKSSDVGDLVRLEDGRLMMVDMCGFTAVPLDQAIPADDVKDQ